jgi:hypothetical protein
MDLTKRLESHWLAVSAAATATGAFGVVESAQGALVFHWPAGVSIPANIDGVYLNLVTGATGSNAASVSGWDINPFLFSGQGTIFTNTGSGIVSSSPTGGVYDLPLASFVGPASVYDTGIVSATPASLLDPLTIGFRFVNEFAGNQTQYGWMRLRLPQPEAPGEIYYWAYDDSGAEVAAGFVPTPGAFSMLTLGAAGLAGRRSRRG